MDCKYKNINLRVYFACRVVHNSERIILAFPYTEYGVSQSVAPQFWSQVKNWVES